MATSATTLCAAGAAFAVGVAVTVTFVSLNAGGAPGTAGVTQAESRTAPPSVADRPWSDPVKLAGTSTPSRQEARAPLTFKVDRGGEQVGAEQPKRAGTEGTRNPSRPERAQATQAEEVGLRAKSEQAQADQARAQQARADAIKAEHNRAERARLEQARAAALNTAAAGGSRAMACRQLSQMADAAR